MSVIQFPINSRLSHRNISSIFPLIAVEAPGGLIKAELFRSALALHSRLEKEGRDCEVCFGYMAGRTIFQERSKFTHVIFLDGREVSNFAAVDVLDDMVRSGREAMQLFDHIPNGRLLGWIASRAAYLKQPHFI